MAIALDDDQLALAKAVGGFIERHAPMGRTRADLEALAAGGIPPVWDELVAQGYTTLHLPEPYGGGTYVDLAVVLEQAGQALLPGPLLPTVITSSVIARVAKPETASLLERLAEGATAAAAFSPGELSARRCPEGWVVDGSTGPVLGAANAEILLLAAASEEGTVWFAVQPAEVASIRVSPLSAVDQCRGIASVTLDALTISERDVLDVDTEDVRTVAAVLSSAEAAGIAAWCLKTATDYAKIREQFGRTIGSFQAIKHRLANMFIVVQTVVAAAWDGARALDDADHEQALLSGAAAAITSLPAVAQMGLDTVTLLGGIGYTWEHDTHLYWRRAMSLNSLLGPVEDWQRSLGARSRLARRVFDVDVEDIDLDFDTRVSRTFTDIAALPVEDRRAAIADAGLVLPHYPAPYGLAATAAQQIVIARKFAESGVEQPKIVIGEWALPTIIEHGSQEQRDTFVSATLRGDIKWCQLFSEPGAGSDLAALATRAEPVEGGWKLTGQKIWTSMARQANWAICLARTDPAAPKHRGITYFLVDMSSAGLDVRPLREANGGYMFNEVFFDGVFVPDNRVVGEINEGWRLARTTLSNERVSISGNMQSSLLDRPPFDGEGMVVINADEATRSFGALTAESYALAAMGLREVVRRVAGLRPGVESSAAKVASGRHRENLANEAMRWCGPLAATAEGLGGAVSQQLLSIPSVLIGGGTVEVQLNVIAERILGLPREEVANHER